MKKKKAPLVIVLIVVLVILVATAGYYYLHRPVATPAPVTEGKLPTVDIPEEEPNYITETCFDGSIEIDPIVFKYPFQKTALYSRNKDYLELLDDEFVEGIQNRAESFCRTFYGADKTKLIREYSETEKNLISFYGDDKPMIDNKGNFKDTLTYVADFLKLVADAGIQADIEFITDKSLIFKDTCLYVRGLITLTVYNIEPGIDISAYFPDNFEEGKKYQMIVDVGMIPRDSSSADTYQVVEVHVVHFEKVE